MNYANTATIADALALHIADASAFFLPFETGAAEPTTKGATIAEAVATVGTLDLTASDWVATMDGFRRDGGEIERLEEEIDWIGEA